MQKHIQHNKDERTQFFRKTYLSLYWKDCVWEVSWRRNRLRHIDTPTLLGCLTGSLGPSLCLGMVLIPASSLQLIWTSCRRGYIIIWHPPSSCKRHNSHSIQPPDSQSCPLISSTGCTCYLHRCISSFGGQYATVVEYIDCFSAEEPLKRESFIWHQTIW